MGKLTRYKTLALMLVAAALALSTTGPAAAEEPAVAEPSADAYVRPIDWERFALPAPTDPNAGRVEQALLNASRYGLTTWWHERYGGQTGRYLTLGGNAEGHIRPPASEAYAIAVALKTGAYDATVTGVPDDEARAIAVRLATSIAFRHRATSAGGWGNDWQTALWAYYAGNAAWLLWDDLSAEDRRHVADMLVFEADRFLEYQVPYYRDRDGVVRIPGDSKAEENAWNANLLQLVTAMMPRHPHQAQWMTKNVELMVSAFARPSDLTNQRVLHGRPVAEWLAGSNIDENGTLVNHGFTHPDYMATVAMNTSGPLTYGLAGLPAPEASRFNADVVYAALSTVVFPSPPFRAPGGTTYVRDTAGQPSDQIYYPQGNDWGTHRRAHFVVVDASADLFGFDDLAAAPGADWERVHARSLVDMQARGTDGRTYQAAGEDTYSGREQWVAVEIARAYLAHWVDAQNAVRWTNQAYPVLNVDVSAPALVPAGQDRPLDLTLRPSLTSAAASRVSVAVDVPDGLSAEPTGPTSWAFVGQNGVSTSLRLRADDDASGPAVVTVRVRYRLPGGEHEARRTVTVPIAPRPPAADTWVSDLPWMTMSNGFGPALLDTNFYGQPIGVGGTTHTKGVWTHAPAALTYYVAGQCRRLTAVVGIDDSMQQFGADRGSVVYRVRRDGDLVFDSGRLTGSMAALPIDVDISGAQMLQLEVTDAGDGKSHDHAPWASARLTCGE